jgi:hypothetical protein
MSNLQIMMIIISCLILAITISYFITRKDTRNPNFNNTEHKVICHPIHGFYLCVQCEHIHNSKIQCPNCLGEIFLTLPRLLNIPKVG